VVELALGQLNAVVAREVYSALKPDNPGLRTGEIDRKSYSEIANALASRLANLKSNLDTFSPDDWKNGFVLQCEAKHAELKGQWSENWVKLCSGKLLIDDIYREYTPGLSKFDFKRRLAKRMKSEQTEDWTLVKSKIRDALGV
jgi:hypothetical protein